MASQGLGIIDQGPNHGGTTFAVLRFPFCLRIWRLGGWSRSLWRLVQGIAPELVGVVAPAVDAVAKDHIAVHIVVHAVPPVRPVQCLERLQIGGTVAGLQSSRPAPLVEVLPAPGRVLHQQRLCQANPAVQAVLRDDHLEIAVVGLEVFQVVMLKAADIVLQVVGQQIAVVMQTPGAYVVWVRRRFVVRLEVLVQQQDMLGPGTVLRVVGVGLAQHGLDTVIHGIFFQFLFPKIGGGSGIGEGKQATAVDEIARSRWFYQSHALHFVPAEQFQFSRGGAQHFVDHDPVVHAVGQICLEAVQFRPRRQYQVVVELGCLFGSGHDLGLHPIIGKVDSSDHLGVLNLSVLFEKLDRRGGANVDVGLETGRGHAEQVIETVEFRFAASGFQEQSLPIRKILVHVNQHKADRRLPSLQVCFHGIGEILQQMGSKQRSHGVPPGKSKLCTVPK